MRVLVRAVITGFGLSVGAALYKKVAKQLGLEDPKLDDAAKAQGAVSTSSTGDSVSDQTRH
jgi:hypothetical protein